nr:sulfatase-like hydrolase/transferase [Anaerolineae bacterium]NIN95557.1 sulfatase-like hydrolase/transferase [Anaerolineae bacterium]NIQ78550.1 sulfatase-like hydrolase/transferase [Anaerolineae bacterium]
TLLPIALAVGLAAVSWLGLSFVLKDKRKAGFIVSLLFLLIFSYENLFEATKALIARVGWIEGSLVRLGLSVVEVRQFVLLASGAVFAAAVYFLVKTRRSLHNLTNIANVVAGAAVVISLTNIAIYEASARLALPGDVGGASPEIPSADLSGEAALPDIYYIILDGYARGDVLQEIYGYDNSEFLDYLAKQGFYIADGSRANYCQTALSLASSLNLKYVDYVAERVGTDYRRRGPLADAIRDNTVFRFLEQRGYAIVAFASGWSATEVTTADAYMAARWTPGEFEADLIDMTPIPFVGRALGVGAVYDMHGLQRERILYAFDHLADTTELKGPVFVFAHIVAPHPPFVLGRDGEAIDPGFGFTLKDGNHVIKEGRLTRDQYLRGYVDQLMYTNRALKSALEEILSRSAEDPIIILQSDHGPGSRLDWDDPYNTDLRERLSILNAYYLPGKGSTELYAGITPVNTFRLILDLYFGTDCGLLEDRSYFSTWSQPYAFIDVTNELDYNTSRAPQN